MWFYIVHLRALISPFLVAVMWQLHAAHWTEFYILAMGKLRDLHYESLEHPPYSPYLSPSDFCLFPKLKRFLTGQRFSSNQEAIGAVEGYFADLTSNHYRDGIMALEHRWNKCISFKRDYVEKKNNFEIINSFFSVRPRTFQTTLIHSPALAQRKFVTSAVDCTGNWRSYGTEGAK